LLAVRLAKDNIFQFCVLHGYNAHYFKFSAYVRPRCRLLGYQAYGYVFVSSNAIFVSSNAM